MKRLINTLKNMFTADSVGSIVIVFVFVAILSSIDYSKWGWYLGIAIFFVFVTTYLDGDDLDDEKEFNRWQSLLLLLLIIIIFSAFVWFVLHFRFVAP